MILSGNQLGFAAYNLNVLWRPSPPQPKQLVVGWQSYSFFVRYTSLLLLFLYLSLTVPQQVFLVLYVPLSQVYFPPLF